MKKLFDPYKKMQKNKEEPLFLFPNVKREINGKKFNYGGEYPNDGFLLRKIRKNMNGNGYDVFFQQRKDTVIIWWNKKDGIKKR